MEHMYLCAEPATHVLVQYLKHEAKCPYHHHLACVWLLDP
jgi:hypothetical protein